AKATPEQQAEREKINKKDIPSLEDSKSKLAKIKEDLKSGQIAEEELDQYQWFIGHEIAVANAQVDRKKDLPERPPPPPVKIPNELEELEKNRDELWADLARLEKEGKPNKYKLLKAKVSVLIAENERNAWIAKNVLERLKRPQPNMTPEEVDKQRELTEEFGR